MPFSINVLYVNKRASGAASLVRDVPKWAMGVDIVEYSMVSECSGCLVTPRQ
jgi:hypothetical protein